MEKTTAERIGANVRAEMARAGMSQTTLAQTIGMAQPAVSKRLRGVIAFDVNELTRVAAALGLDLATLLAEDRAFLTDKQSA